MKLLELLVKERVKWPADAEKVCQGHDLQIERVDEDGDSFLTDIYLETLSENYRKRSKSVDECDAEVVTKEQYDNACALVDDGYTLWFGGECPVQGDTIVSVAWLYNDQCGKFENTIASDFNWTKPDAILGYKVIGEKPVSIDIIRKPFDFVNPYTSAADVVDNTYPAHSFLEKGVQHMKDRAAQRDSADGERSMAACVNAFNAMFGKDLTETQGWQFMVLLKMARSRNSFNPDDYEDGAAYTGLAGEAHSHE